MAHSRCARTRAHRWLASDTPPPNRTPVALSDCQTSSRPHSVLKGARLSLCGRPRAPSLPPPMHPGAVACVLLAARSHPRQAAARWLITLLLLACRCRPSRGTRLQMVGRWLSLSWRAGAVGWGHVWAVWTRGDGWGRCVWEALGTGGTGQALVLAQEVVGLPCAGCRAGARLAGASHVGAGTVQGEGGLAHSRCACTRAHRWLASDTPPPSPLLPSSPV